ncbi:MAG TPA: hypothetical protein VLX59_15400 [Acidimicrobiales bacterium]|nr:hypothetical protein [Acidimicrobiales bacterium]
MTEQTLTSSNDVLPITRDTSDFDSQNPAGTISGWNLAQNHPPQVRAMQRAD